MIARAYAFPTITGKPIAVNEREFANDAYWGNCYNVLGQISYSYLLSF